MEIIHQGFDGLEVAFKGALPGPLRRELERAKREAKSSMNNEHCVLAGVDCWVRETGAKGGYAFVFDTGPDGEIWTIKDNDSPDNWNFRVKVRAVQLALDGFQIVVDHLYDTLRRWNARITEDSVARIDYAVDFISPDFAPTYQKIVCHSHSTKRQFIDNMSEQEPQIFACGDRVTSVTIGKMPGRQICIYDKRREAIQTQKGHWFEIWGIPKEECPVVWRVEVRAGKKHLQNWNIRTLEELKEHIGHVFRDDLESIRLINNPEVQNRARDGVLDDVWIKLIELVPLCMDTVSKPLVKGRIVSGRRADIEQIYTSQIKGLVSGLAVSLGMDTKQASSEIPDYVHCLMENYVKENKATFISKFIKASKRLKFLDFEGGKIGKKSNLGSSGMSGMWEGNPA